MQKRTICNFFIIPIFFTASLSFARDDKKLVEQIMASSLDYSITFSLKSPVKTEKEKETDFYEEGLSTEDVKLGKVIFKAMLLCGIFGEFAIRDQGGLFLLIRYSRWQYKQDKETMVFIQYLAKKINKKYSCMDNWLKYYEAFILEDKYSNSE